MFELLIYPIFVGAVSMSISQENDHRHVIFDPTIRAMGTDVSSDGKKFVVASAKWKVFNLDTGKVQSHGHFGGYWAVQFSPDGTRLALAGNYNLFRLYDVHTGQVIWDLTREGHVDVIDQVLFTPDGKKMISVSNGEKRVRLWDIANKQAEAAFHFTGLGTAKIGIELKTYVEKAKRIYEYERVKGLIRECVLMPDGKTLAVTAYPGKISFLDLETGKITSTIACKQQRASALRISADGKWLFIGGYDENYKNGQVEIWDLDTRDFLSAVAKHEAGIYRISVSTDKKFLLTVSDSVRLWDLATGKMKHRHLGKDDARLPRTKVFDDGSKYEEKEVGCAGCGFLPDGKTFWLVPSWEFWGTEAYFYDTVTGEVADYRKRVVDSPKKQESK